MVKRIHLVDNLDAADCRDFSLPSPNQLAMVRGRLDETLAAGRNHTRFTSARDRMNQCLNGLNDGWPCRTLGHYLGRRAPSKLTQPVPTTTPPLRSPSVVTSPLLHASSKSSSWLLRAEA